MFYAVAEVRDPYRASSDRVPLPVGLFVQAEIQGRTVPDALRLPPTAVREGHQVLVVDGNQTVHVREIEVLRNNHEAMIVRGELAPGERVLLAGAEAPLPGTTVRPKESVSSERAVHAEAPAP
jgi:multidrug efflux pump subunit AcrA (membrane-fusion protein)